MKTSQQILFCSTRTKPLLRAKQCPQDTAWDSMFAEPDKESSDAIKVCSGPFNGQNNVTIACWQQPQIPTLPV